MITTLACIETIAQDPAGLELVRDERIAARLSDRDKAAVDRDHSAVPVHADGPATARRVTRALHEAGVALLVDGDPTSDITATRAITDIWRRGVRLPR